MRSCSLSWSCSRSRAAVTNITATDDEPKRPCICVAACLWLHQALQASTNWCGYSLYQHPPKQLCPELSCCSRMPSYLSKPAVKTQAATRTAAHLLLQQGDVGLHAVPTVCKT